MAKGQKRSNREIKKPKQAKPKPAATGTLSSIAAAKTNPGAGGKKK